MNVHTGPGIAQYDFMGLSVPAMTDISIHRESEKGSSRKPEVRKGRGCKTPA
jgi:hypothetical protein